jgi:hypothetical protein
VGKGGSQKQTVNEYHMSVHFGMCSELDAITGIYVGEKLAWSGEHSVEYPIYVDNINLFGGPKKEGGVNGTAWYLPGGPTQVLPSFLTARHGLTPSTHPAYRGIASIYFVGSSLNPGAGFMWGATPYMQSVWFTGRRAPKGLNPDYAMIGNPTTVSIDGYVVTVNSTTVTVTDGHATLVGSSTVTVTHSEIDLSISVLVDGTSITVTPDPDDDFRKIITVNGDDRSIPYEGGTVTAGGLSVSLFGTALTFQMGVNGGDANPSHIIYECLTNTTWGMGADDTIVDRDNFEAVAVKLYHEGFGLSLQWTRENSIQAFVSEILDHIQAALFVDPETGKLTLKLFRDDYDETTLPLITPDNADLDNFQRKLWGETVNEIVVTWTNPTNEQEETVTQQMLGNVIIQGGVVSDSRNYYAARYAGLAQRLALRDVRQSSAPLATAEAKLDRTQWNLRPGSVVRLTWPEYEIENVIMRVGVIDYGKIGTPEIGVSLMEDIFSLDHATFAAPAESSWVDPSSDPSPLDHVRVITSPAYFTSRRLTAAEAGVLTYPDVMANILAADSHPDTSSYDLFGQTVLPNGTTVAENLGTRPLLGYGTLQADIAAEASTLVPTFGTVVGGQGPIVSGFVFIGNAVESYMEIALIASSSDTGWVLTRGVLDTVPRAWPAGSSLWFYDIRTDFFDPDTHSDAETVSYKMLPRTSRGSLALTDAPVLGALLGARPHLPNRPANVTVGGASFGAVDLSGSSPTTVHVTWAIRNRTMEDGTVLAWTDGGQPAESGQTTKIRVIKTDGTVLATHTGLTGSSYDLPVSDWGSEVEADVAVTSVRDGFESLQGLSIRCRVTASGGSVTPPTTTPPSDPYVPPTTYPPTWHPICPVSETQILLANDTLDGPGGTIRADRLVPGQTWVWTQHEDTMEWGAHLVVKAVVFPNQPVMRAEGYPRATATHPFWLPARGWTTMGEFGEPDGRDDVVWITVADAHTFVSVEPDGTQILSHNKEDRGPDE